MDGSYGNIYPAGRSPGAPSSSGEQYKVNVSRQKTRKWAEFKPANYDGDEWGDEYNDGPSEPSAPPPKPLGPRQPSAAPATRQFQPASAPPLHIPGQQSQSPWQTHPDPSSPFLSGVQPMGGAPERKATGPLPESAATGSSVYSAGPAYGRSVASPITSPSSRQMSPAPAGAGSVPTRFPPRKSSMGAYDAPDPSEVMRQPRSGSRPGSSHNKPWVEGRSASPSSGKPLASPLASPASPTRLIRPADIYRRMGEEKEKQRRSLESGRPSLDSATGRSGENADPGLESRQDGADQRGREGADVNRSLRPALAPVAERKSEYGIEGLLASYASDEPSVEPDSTSPMLPEFSRISDFGDDFFSPPGSSQQTSLPLPTSTSHSTVPPLYLQSHNSAEEPISSLLVAEDPNRPPLTPPTPTPQNMGFHPARDFSITAEPDAALQSAPEASTSAKSSNEPDQPTASLSQANQSSAGQWALEASHESVSPAAVPPDAALGADDKQALRPHLPGNWVTETLETPSEAPTPAALPEDLPHRAAESRDASPVTKAVNNVAESPSDPAESQDPELYGLSEAVKNSYSSPKDIQPVQPATPSDLTAATSPASEITPTAPLKPRRDQTVETVDFVQPSQFSVPSTLDTSSSSPVKESDVLREEIIKSLSPLQASDDFKSIAGGPTAAYQAAAEPTRESSYLGDVYGDYWASPDEKHDPLPVEAAKILGKAPVEAPVKAHVEASVEAHVKTPIETPIETPVEIPVEKGILLRERREAEIRPGDMRRQFSWEANSEDTKTASPQSPTPESQVEKEAVGPDSRVGNAPVFLAELEGSASETNLPRNIEPAELGNSHLSPTTRTDSAPGSNKAPGSGISHQVSEASTMAPRSNLDIPLEPPSPLSVVSNRAGQRQEMQTLSVSEEKIPAQELSDLPSLFSPLGSSPALALGAELQPTRSPAPPAPPAKDLVSIVPFRQIMEMQAASERIKYFNETRAQFASIETGLGDWLLELRSKYPEHAGATWSFRTALVGPNGPPNWQQGSQIPGQATVPTPYFQQHPNNSISVLAEGGRPANNIPMPPQSAQHGPGGFGLSGNQVGTKSKGLLLAAGKAGKGLLSKGKNKLKGTGDKVFSNP
ncbi:hypothetical protein B0T24DRAFT_535279 [Lasiosphaeria ovina]|uniref:Uncharacterized protein n=1 Tax=Lasiosphaeria ovina TaxID=92902 RepID=A0AAE0N1V0_9PEZI|nr:hypothetical protein B0T24DRAFT_535279 [Lasiosphaeria ovina]